jgi:hypothetical protein
MLFSSPMEMAGTSMGRTFGGPPLLGALGPLALPGPGIAQHMSFFFGLISLLNFPVLMLLLVCYSVAEFYVWICF